MDLGETFFVGEGHEVYWWPRKKVSPQLYPKKHKKLETPHYPKKHKKLECLKILAARGSYSFRRNIKITSLLTYCGGGVESLKNAVKKFHILSVHIFLIIKFYSHLSFSSLPFSFMLNQFLILCY